MEGDIAFVFYKFLLFLLLLLLWPLQLISPLSNSNQNNLDTLIAPKVRSKIMYFRVNCPFKNVTKRCQACSQYNVTVCYFLFQHGVISFDTVTFHLHRIMLHCRKKNIYFAETQAGCFSLLLLSVTRISSSSSSSHSSGSFPHLSLVFWGNTHHQCSPWMKRFCINQPTPDLRSKQVIFLLLFPPCPLTNHLIENLTAYFSL